MVHCRIESIFSFPSLFWKTKTKSEFQIGITFLIIGIFLCGFQHFVTGPRSAVGNVSGNRCESDCRSRGRKFDPGPVPYFRGD